MSMMPSLRSSVITGSLAKVTMRRGRWRSPAGTQFPAGLRQLIFRFVDRIQGSSSDLRVVSRQYWCLSASKLTLMSSAPGDGTEGCVLANRLSTDEGVSVLSVGRGGVEDNWISQIPLFAQILRSPRIVRLHVHGTVPQERADERVIELTDGKSLGGASKINAMLYTRGLPAEFNSRSAASCEDRLRADDSHGTSGIIMEAVKSLDIPYIDDLNSPSHPSHGCAKMHYTIDGSRRHSSTLSAFLPQKLVNERRNLQFGIGPAEHLKNHAKAVIKDNAAVRAHMQDHMFILLYMFYGIGLLLAPVLEMSIFVQSRLFDSDFRIITHDLVSSKSKGDGGLVFLAIALRPTSLGTVRLASSHPLDDPIIDPQYLSTEHDRVIKRKTVRLALWLGKQVAAQGYPIISFEVPASEKDEDVDAFVRKWCHTSFHYTSTCRMAPESENGIDGVVNDRLRVHGVRGLRIADSSIFPHILSAHTAAATVAVAEKCADMIKEDRGSKEAQSVSQFVY
ncbi:GMC oxidoreductase [Laetiporus sulphureus 93-53]|uniref:GMC oxidoreductase n=1 Tax=Laetiporus sulphureus 93-53 TaxID=1314785 RepID=A0A165EE95_9APHY|nr:GMC oxidoreductase [Laetiporus sulphureus 93-53]KZT06854.1 GMC oxidoreductase [Laetiporus sulphureus 93-53]